MIFRICKFCNKEFHAFKDRSACPRCGRKTLKSPVWLWVLASIAMFILLYIGLHNAG